LDDFNHLSLYRGKLSLKDPNLDVSNLPLLEWIYTHPNLDVSNLLLLEWIYTHPHPLGGPG